MVEAKKAKGAPKNQGRDSKENVVSIVVASLSNIEAEIFIL